MASIAGIISVGLLLRVEVVGRWSERLLLGMVLSRVGTGWVTLIVVRVAVTGMMAAAAARQVTVSVLHSLHPVKSATLQIDVCFSARSCSVRGRRRCIDDQWGLYPCRLNSVTRLSVARLDGWLSADIRMRGASSVRSGAIVAERGELAPSTDRGFELAAGVIVKRSVGWGVCVPGLNQMLRR